MSRRGMFLSPDFNYCPGCGRAYEAYLHGVIPSPHTVCSGCGRCWMCQEMASRGWSKNHPADTSVVRGDEEKSTDPDRATPELTLANRQEAATRQKATRRHCVNCRPGGAACKVRDCFCHLPAVFSS